MLYVASVVFAVIACAGFEVVGELVAEGDPKGAAVVGRCCSGVLAALAVFCAWAA